MIYSSVSSWLVGDVRDLQSEGAQVLIQAEFSDGEEGESEGESVE